MLFCFKLGRDHGLPSNDLLTSIGYFVVSAVNLFFSYRDNGSLPFNHITMKTLFCSFEQHVS